MLRDKIIEIFVKTDDFYIEFSQEIKKHLLESKIEGKRNRKASLSDSEIISILILFHYGQFHNFKSFYINYVLAHLKDLFPKAVSYNRFIELQHRVAVPFMLFMKYRCLGKSHGLNFVDSTPLRVCHNKRIHNNKVFKEFAERGHCSIGWFYGFKLHLIVNDKGEILSFYLTKGNVDDRDFKVMKNMTKDIFGKLFGDRGSISKALADFLFMDGIQMIAKPRKNMKDVNISTTDRILLRKRSIIETINDELKNLCKLEHTRHRSINNFLINILGALSAYSFFQKKPSLNIEWEYSNQLLLYA